MAYFEFDNKRIYYKLEGQGDPLLFLHGNTASSRMFDCVINEYAKFFQVMVLDFPGHGKSDRVQKFENDFWFYNAKVCYHLLEFLAIDRIAVVGTSGGALVAINLGLEHPERIKSIVADSFEGEYPLATYIDTLEKDRAAGKDDPDTRAFWESNHGPDWEKIVDQDTEMLLNFSGLNQSFFHGSMADLSVPTLLTGSRQDEFCKHLDTIYSKMKAKNNKLEIHLFEQGSHPALLSNAKESLELVVKKIKAY